MDKRTFWVLAALFGLFLLTTQGGVVWNPAGAEPPASAESKGPPRVRPRAAPLTEEQEAELLAALKEKLPYKYERLVKLREERPRAYRWALRGAWRSYQRWKDLPPEVQEAAITEQAERITSMRILHAIRDEEDPEKKARYKEQLKESVQRQFDAEETRQKHQLQVLKERILRLEEELKRRTEDRDKIIDEQVERYLKGPPPGRIRAHPGTRPGRIRSHKPSQ
jgi:hypothetical protein